MILHKLQHITKIESSRNGKYANKYMNRHEKNEGNGERKTSSEPRFSMSPTRAPARPQPSGTFFFSISFFSSSFPFSESPSSFLPWDDAGGSSKLEIFNHKTLQCFMKMSSKVMWFEIFDKDFFRYSFRVNEWWFL